MPEAPDVPDAAATNPAARVALRLATTYAGTTRHTDLELRGGRGVVVEEGGAATPFAVERLWPVVHDLLPPEPRLRSQPPTRRARAVDDVAPPATFADDVRAMAVVATLVDDGGPTSGVVAVRTWLATPDRLWSVTPRPDGTSSVRAAADGELAELLVWDVTAALEALVRRLETAS